MNELNLNNSLKNVDFVSKTILQIEKDFEKRVARNQAKKEKFPNALRETVVDIDDIYDVDEGNGSCNICHK